MIQNFHQFFENRYLIDSVWNDGLDGFVHYRKISSKDVGSYTNTIVSSQQSKFLNKNKIHFIVGFDDKENPLLWFSYFVFEGGKYLLNYHIYYNGISIEDMLEISDSLKVKNFNHYYDTDTDIHFDFNNIEEVPHIMFFTEDMYPQVCIDVESKAYKSIHSMLMSLSEEGRVNTTTYYYNKILNKIELIGLKVITDVKSEDYDIYIWRNYTFGKMSGNESRLPCIKDTTSNFGLQRLIVYSEYDDNFYYGSDCFQMNGAYINNIYKDKIELLSLRKIDFSNRIQSYNFVLNLVKTFDRGRYMTSVLEMDKNTFSLDKDKREISVGCKFKHDWLTRKSEYIILITVREKHNGYNVDINFSTKDKKIVDVYNIDIENILDIKGDCLTDIIKFLNNCKKCIVDKDSPNWKYYKKGRSKRNKR